MAQRQFDMENEQDVKDLFDILPDTIKKITKEQTEESGHHIIYGLEHLFNIKWGNKTSVGHPVDKSKWIGTLCWFWDNEDINNKIIGTLERRILEKYWRKEGARWDHCRPVKREEIKFVEDGE